MEQCEYVVTKCMCLSCYHTGAKILGRPLVEVTYREAYDAVHAESIKERQHRTMRKEGIKSKVITDSLVNLIMNDL